MPQRATYVLSANTSAANEACQAVRARCDELGLTDIATATAELVTNELVLNCLRAGVTEITLELDTTDETGTNVVVAVAPSDGEPIESGWFPDPGATQILRRYARGWAVTERDTGTAVSFELRDTERL